MSDSADRGDVLTAKRHDESDNKCVICCGDFVCEIRESGEGS